MSPVENGAPTVRETLAVAAAFTLLAAYGLAHFVNALFEAVHPVA